MQLARAGFARSLEADLSVLSTVGSAVTAPREWLAVVGVACLSACVPADDDLPEPRSHVSLPGSACTPAQHGIESTPVALGTPAELESCVSIAWDTGCDGSVRFEVEVDEWGGVSAARFEGDGPEALRQCVSTRLGQTILLPATDCAGTRMKSTAQGAILWGSDKGTYVGFANDKGIIGYLRPECMPQIGRR